MTDALIEKTIAELDHVCYGEFNASASLFPAAARKILAAAFAEVRRGALEEAKLAIMDATEPELKGAYSAVHALLPPAAEGVANLPGLLRAAAERMCGCGELMDEDGCPRGH